MVYRCALPLVGLYRCVGTRRCNCGDPENLRNHRCPPRISASSVMALNRWQGHVSPFPFPMAEFTCHLLRQRVRTHSAASASKQLRGRPLLLFAVSTPSYFQVISLLFHSMFNVFSSEYVILIFICMC